MLTLENLSFGVNDEKGEMGIIKDISLTVGDGKFVVITDPSGGGKSTTAKLIIGVERPAGGCILFGEQDTVNMSVTDRTNLGISLVFQRPVRFKGMQAIDLLRLTARKKLTVSEACQYLVEVGLCAKDYINHEVNASLSSGELKRTEIAIVITKASKLFVFDEPKAGIDLWSFRNLTQVFGRMRQSTNGFILIISHQGWTLNTTDEIVVIADGKVVNQGTRDGIIPQIMGTAPAADACSKFYETAQ